MANLVEDYREFSLGLLGVVMILGLFGIAAGARFGGTHVDADSCFAGGTGSNGCYCENMLLPLTENGEFRLAPGARRARIKQPINTWSNLGFIAMGLGLLWWQGWERRTGTRSALANRMTRTHFYPVTFAAMAIFMGPGSMFFHASLTRWGGWVDGVSMYLFMSYILVYNITRYFDLSRTWWIVLYACVNAGMAVAGWLLHEDATLVFAGLGLATLAVQLLVAETDRIGTTSAGQWWFFAGMATFAAAFVIWRLAWTGAPWCRPLGTLQGHAVWHLLASFVVFSVYMYFREESRKAEPLPGVLRVFAGTALGGGLAFAFYAGGLQLLGASDRTALVVGIVTGVLGAVYGGIAGGLHAYQFGVLSFSGPSQVLLVFSRKLQSTLGFVFDVTWSLLNSVGGLFIWGPISMLAGAKLAPRTDVTRRFGVVVFDANLMGFEAMTVGPVIAGSFIPHEVVHTWQARLFGPAWLPIYILSFVLNVICRLLTFRIGNFFDETYHRICFEDAAFWSEDGTAGFAASGLVLGFVLCTAFVAAAAAAAVGVIAGPSWLAWLAIGVLVVYSYVRAWLQRNLGGTR